VRYSSSLPSLAKTNLLLSKLCSSLFSLFLTLKSYYKLHSKPILYQVLDFQSLFSKVFIFVESMDKVLFILFINITLIILRDNLVHLGITILLIELILYLSLWEPNTILRKVSIMCNKLRNFTNTLVLVYYL